jgi:glycosyltransferase involved in cell wall biosynthesis
MRMKTQLGPPWHVVHVIGSLRVGGAEMQLLNYLLAADTDRFRHTVLCLSSRGPLAERLAGSKVDVKLHAVRQRTMPWHLARLARWMRRENVAVVHAHMFWSALWGRLAGTLAGVPVLVSTEHGQEKWKNRLQIELDHLLSRRTCRHIVVSRYGMQLRRERERIAPEKLLYLPNGVSVPEKPGNPAVRTRVRTQLGFATDQVVVGTVGRLVAAKAYEHLLEAFARIRARIPDACLLVVGDGPQRQELEVRADALGLGQAVKFLGLRDDVRELLAALDVFVLSSIREGLPVALLEAMAAGLAIVVTDVGGMPEVVEDEISGLVVPAGDPGALATAVQRLLSDRDAAAGLGAAAHARARQDYSIDAVARRIEAIYIQCLSARGIMAAGDCQRSAEEVPG